MCSKRLRESLDRPSPPKGASLFNHIPQGCSRVRQSWEKPERAASQGRLRFSQTAAHWQQSSSVCGAFASIHPVTHGTWLAHSALASSNELHVSSSHTRRMAPPLQPISCTFGSRHVRRMALLQTISRPRFSESTARWQQSSSAHSALASTNQLHSGSSQARRSTPSLQSNSCTLATVTHTAWRLASINKLQVCSSQAQHMAPLLQSNGCTVAAVKLMCGTFSSSNQPAAQWQQSSSGHGAIASVNQMHVGSNQLHLDSSHTQCVAPSLQSNG